MNRNDVINEYFEWLYNLVCGKRYSKQVDYRKLLMFLHDTEFTYFVGNDGIRAENGIDLRWKFALSKDGDRDELQRYLEGPCSVLEMLVALSMSCEELMDNPLYGDRTGQWFWEMIVNLGLGAMFDSHFDKQFVEEAVTRFLNREYEPNGKGGLFTIRNCDRDLRTVDIWYQLCWYLDSIT